MFGPNNTLSSQIALKFFISGTNDPTVVPTDGNKGTLYVRYSGRTGNAIGFYQKQDDGLSINWLPFSNLSPSYVNPIIITSDYVIAPDDTCILSNSAGIINLTLPDALTFGKLLRLKNIGTNDLNINPILSQFIDGLPNFTLNFQYQAIVLIPAGGNWFIW